MNVFDTKKIQRLYESIYYNDTLNPKFWVDGEFDVEVKRKLLQIAEDFFNSLELKVPVLDVQLTGSLANYNYTEYSDLDTHIIIDFKQINDDEELVKKALDGVRFVWNQRHDIVIKGHDVELYIQDESEQHTASGLYSLLKGNWIKVPKYNPPEVDERDVNVKEKEYIKEILKMEQKVSQENLPSEEYKALENRAKKLKDKIQQGRKKCLSGPNASEFCVENLVFKNLRNKGMIEKLIDIASKAYDKVFSEN
jgi:predicted nucleotidyltransferase